MDIKWNIIKVLITRNISTVSVAKGRETLILQYCEIENTKPAKLSY